MTCGRQGSHGATLGVTFVDYGDLYGYIANITFLKRLQLFVAIAQTLTTFRNLSSRFGRAGSFGDGLWGASNYLVFLTLGKFYCKASATIRLLVVSDLPVGFQRFLVVVPCVVYQSTYLTDSI